MRKMTIFGMAILLTAVISCTKDEQLKLNDEVTEKSADVFGTYTGTLTTKSTNTVTNATLEATMIDSMTVEIHCYGEEMDTTFTMYMYENGDSTMLCYTDSMFMMEYGHHNMWGNGDDDSDNGGMGGNGDGGMGGNGDGGMGGSGDGGMNGDNSGMGNNGMMDWMQHMESEHDSTDMHYGGFDLMNQTCDYTIKINSGDKEILKRFQGTKQ